MTQTHESGIPGTAKAEPQILLLDDEPDTLVEIRDLLETAGWNAAAAGSPQDALAALVQHPSISVVVTDIRMPGMDGITFAKRLSALHRGGASAPKVIFITGHAGMAEAKNAVRLGAVDFLEKPFDPDHLLSAVVAAFETAYDERQAAADVKHARESLQKLTQALETLQTFGGETPRGPASSPQEPALALDLVRDIRRVVLDGERDAADPFWDILFELARAELEGCRLTVSALITATGLPVSSAQRRLAAARSMGYVGRAPGADDRRFAEIRITRAGREALSAYVRRVHDALTLTARRLRPPDPAERTAQSG